MFIQISLLPRSLCDLLIFGGDVMLRFIYFSLCKQMLKYNNDNNNRMDEHPALAVVLRRLEEDVLVADFRWSILVAAACSYRHDSVLRPFPPMLLRRRVVNNRHENSPEIHANGLLEDRDYAAMVSVHVIVVISSF